MVSWDRQKPWRQGLALACDSAVRLGLISEEERADSVAVVISHDCDLANTLEHEPGIEIIVTRRVETSNGNYTHAKNPRKLHLKFEERGKPAHLEFTATDKRVVQKELLADDLPNREIELSPRGQTILQRWLAARYHRSAFPDEFADRMRLNDLDKRIAKILERLGEQLIAVFFDVDNGEVIERSCTVEPYELRVYILFSTEYDPGEAEAQAVSAAQLISDAFRRYSDGATVINLVSCEAISDTAMPYYLAVQMKKWNIDYLSLRSDSSSAAILT